MKMLSCLVAAVLAAGAAPAQAQTATSAPAAAPDAPPPDNASPFATKPVADERLGTIAGQADILEVINAENRSTVANNRVIGNSVTGNISFDSSAFSDLNGLALISANSGNNVAINASLNVNVAIRP